MTIEDWKNDGCPFFLGVEIYRQQIGRDALLAKFEKYENGFVPSDIAEQLKIELEKASLPKEQEQSPSPEPQKPKSPEPTPNGEPEQIENLRQEIRKQYKTFSFLHSQLGTDIAEKNRYRIARTIIEDILPDIDQMYDDIRNWKDTGQLPVEWDMRLVKQVMKALTRRRTVKQQINRLKAAIERLPDHSGDANKMQIEIDDKTKELAYLSRKLGIQWPPENEH